MRSFSGSVSGNEPGVGSSTVAAVPRSSGQALGAGLGRALSLSWGLCSGGSALCFARLCFVFLEGLGGLRRLRGGFGRCSGRGGLGWNHGPSHGGKAAGRRPEGVQLFDAEPSQGVLHGRANPGIEEARRGGSLLARTRRKGSPTVFRSYSRHGCLPRLLGVDHTASVPTPPTKLT